MTQTEGLQALEWITYKPGWEFSGACVGETQLLLKIKAAKAPDTTKTGDGSQFWMNTVTLDVSFKIKLDECRTPMMFVLMVYRFCHAMEEHELNEWFRFHGTAVMPPHAFAGVF